MQILFEAPALFIFIALLLRDVHPRDERRETMPDLPERNRQQHFQRVLVQPTDQLRGPNPKNDLEPAEKEQLIFTRSKLIMNSNQSLWGYHGQLAIDWASAFLNENDSLILQTLIKQNKIKVFIEDLQAETQYYINKEETTNCIDRLEQSFLLKVERSRQTQTIQQQAWQNNKKILHMTLNPTIDLQLQKLLDRIKAYYIKEKHDYEEMKKRMSTKQCRGCETIYHIRDLHLNGQTECNNPYCVDRTLVAFKIDKKIESQIEILNKLIQKLQVSIENCKQQEFPTCDLIQEEAPPLITPCNFYRRIQLQNDVEKSIICQHLIKHRSKRFQSNLNANIQKFIQKKKRYIQPMLIE